MKRLTPTRIHAVLVAALALSACSENDNMLGVDQMQDGGSTGDGSTGDGAPGDGSTGDGAPGDGAPGDGATGDGETGDGATGDELAACTTLPADLSEADRSTLIGLRERALESQALWDARPMADRDYTLGIAIVSWTGWRCTSQLEVQDGVMVRRDVTTHSEEGVDEGWTETGAEIGARPACGIPKLLEALYDECLEDTLCQAPSTSVITFSTDETDGLLRQCSYWPENCADDCDMGPSFELTLN